MKVLLLSHESDIDGLGNVVLAKMAFEDLEYCLFPSVSVLKSQFREYLSTGFLNDFDKIFITDLALGNPSLDMVASDPILFSKVVVLDHHIASINDQLGIYDFTKIEEKDENGKKRCGTEMFYDYLVSCDLLTRSDILDDLVELIRLEDTWEWKTTGEKGVLAHDLAVLLNAVGIQGYIDAMSKKVHCGEGRIVLTDEEMRFIEEKKREYEENLSDLWNSVEIFRDEFGNLFGVVYADYEFRNELAEYIRKQPDKRGIKYIVMIAMEKGIAGQKSYRSIEEDFDVNAIAQLHGGGGHKAAASVNITPEQKAKSLTLQRREGLEYLTQSKFN